jgi:fermentation-respiration switch protein FrsA (DUF1100 family)
MPEIDTDNIFVLGHSLGGMMIPRIAQDATDAKGFIMMGAPTTKLHDLILEQTEYIYNLDDKLTLREKLSIWKTKRLVDRISNLTEDTKYEAKDLLNVSPAYWLYLNNYDMIGMAKNIKKPLLIIQGERDYQVPMRDFDELKSVLGDKDNVSFISYIGLSHLMTTSGIPPSPDDYYNDYIVDQQVIDDIAQFVQDN